MGRVFLPRETRQRRYSVAQEQERTFVHAVMTFSICPAEPGYECPGTCRAKYVDDGNPAPLRMLKWAHQIGNRFYLGAFSSASDLVLPCYVLLLPNSVVLTGLQVSLCFPLFGPTKQMYKRAVPHSPNKHTSHRRTSNLSPLPYTTPRARHRRGLTGLRGQVAVPRWPVRHQPGRHQHQSPHWLGTPLRPQLQRRGNTAGLTC